MLISLSAAPVERGIVPTGSRTWAWSASKQNSKTDFPDHWFWGRATTLCSFHKITTYKCDHLLRFLFFFFSVFISTAQVSRDLHVLFCLSLYRLSSVMFSRMVLLSYTADCIQNIPRREMLNNTSAHAYSVEQVHSLWLMALFIVLMRNLYSLEPVAAASWHKAAVRNLFIVPLWPL